jgi:hypothetical protein
MRPEVFGVRLTAGHGSRVLPVPLTPSVRDFVEHIEQLVDAKRWPGLDRDAITVTPGRDAALVVLPHRRDSQLTLELEVDDRLVHVRYGPERIPFSRRDEALRFLEMLGDGRVELVIRRSPVWTSMRSYRDGLAVPFRRTSEPWPNLRFGTERVAFGFQ